MNCHICHNLMNQITQSEEWEGWQNPPITVPNVTSWICPECGDQCYDSFQAGRIMDAMRRLGEFKEED